MVCTVAGVMVFFFSELHFVDLESEHLAGLL